MTLSQQEHWERQQEARYHQHQAEAIYIEQALADEVANIDMQTRKGDETLINELTEIMCDNDLFWLAVGSGADYLPYRQQAIEKLAEQRLGERQ